MKDQNKLLSIILSVILLFSLTACGQNSTPAESTPPAADNTAAGTEEEAPPVPDETEDEEAAGEAEETYKLAFSIFDLNNVVFAELARELESYGATLGMEVTVADCQNDPTKQLSQLENFLTAEMDCIIFSALDSEAVQPILAEAREKGVKLISYGFDIEGADSKLISDNYNAGYEIGRLAADWINSTFEDGSTEIAVLNQPDFVELVRREEGIIAALEELAPNAKIVASSAAFTQNEGITSVENMLLANPGIQCVVSVCDSAALGGLEVFKVENMTDEQYGIFGCDGTVEALTAIKDGTPFRGTVRLGGGIELGRQLADMSYTLLTGEALEPTVFISMDNITVDNVDDFLE